MVTLRLNAGCLYAQQYHHRSWVQPLLHAGQRNRHKACAAYSGNSARYTGRPDSDQDLLGGLLDACLSSSSRITQSVISKAADMLQSIAPEEAPRQKIEVSVKGALVLLVLGLLKGVINFVLLAGTVGLAVYVATQVFGWNAVVLGQRQQDNYADAARPSQQQQHYQQYGATRQSQAAGSNPVYAGDSSQQAWQQQQQHGPWDSWQKQHQDDVVDVFYGKQPPKQQ